MTVTRARDRRGAGVLRHLPRATQLLEAEPRPPGPGHLHRQTGQARASCTTEFNGTARCRIHAVFGIWSHTGGQVSGSADAG